MRSLVEEIVQAEGIAPGGVSIQAPPDLAAIFDRGHLNQIVWNLVRNAWQHCQKKDSSIRIVVRPGYMGDAVICELSDDGPGIPAELRAQIFEPFFTTKREGIGLGLFLSRAIVESHGGTIDIGSNPDGPGTTVTFSFPPNGAHGLS